VTEYVGVSPETKLEFASLRVIVTVEVSIASGTIGPVPEMDEFAAEAAPATKLMEEPDFTKGVRICSVLFSALIDFNVHVYSPGLAVAVQAEAVLFEPEDENVVDPPETRLLLISFKTIVTVEVATPLATTGPVPVMVE